MDVTDLQDQIVTLISYGTKMKPHN